MSYKKRNFRKKSLKKKHLGGAKVFSTSKFPFSSPHSGKEKYNEERDIYNDIKENISTIETSDVVKVSGINKPTIKGKNDIYTVHELGICLMERGGDTKQYTTPVKRALGKVSRAATGLVGLAVGATGRALAIGTFEALYLGFCGIIPICDFLGGTLSSLSVWGHAWQTALTDVLFTLPNEAYGYARLFGRHDPATSKLLGYMTGDMKRGYDYSSLIDEDTVGHDRPLYLEGLVKVNKPVYNRIHRRDLKMFIGKETGEVGTGEMFSPYFYMVLQKNKKKEGKEQEGDGEEGEGGEMIILAIKCPEIKGITKHDADNLFFNDVENIKKLLLSEDNNIFSNTGFFNDALKTKTHVLKFKKNNIKMKARSRYHQITHPGSVEADWLIDHSKRPLFFTTINIETPSDGRTTSFHMRGESILSSRFVDTFLPGGPLGSVYPKLSNEDVIKKYETELEERVKEFKEKYKVDVNSQEIIEMSLALMSIENASSEDELEDALNYAEAHTILQHTNAIQVGRELLNKVKELRTDGNLVKEVKFSKKIPESSDVNPITLELVKAMEMTKKIFNQIYKKNKEGKIYCNVGDIKKVVNTARDAIGTINKDYSLWNEKERKFVKEYPFEIVGDAELKSLVYNAIWIGKSGVKSSAHNAEPYRAEDLKNRLPRWLDSYSGADSINILVREVLIPKEVMARMEAEEGMLPAATPNPWPHQEPVDNPNGDDGDDDDDDHLEEIEEEIGSEREMRRQKYGTVKRREAQTKLMKRTTAPADADRSFATVESDLGNGTWDDEDVDGGSRVVRKNSKKIRRSRKHKLRNHKKSIKRKSAKRKFRKRKNTKRRR